MPGEDFNNQIGLLSVRISFMSIYMSNMEAI